MLECCLLFFFKRCASLLILQLEVKIVVYITPVTLSTSFVVVKMDPDSYHNEGAGILQGSNIVWENSNVSYFPPPPLPVEIPQPTVQVEIPQPTVHVEIPQPAVFVEIPQPTGKVKAPIFNPPEPTVHVEIPQSTAGRVNAPIFHPKTYKPAPPGSKIKILINELVQVDNLVCYNTLSLMNVLDQSLYGLANVDDDTEIRVTFRNGMDPSFKKVFLEMSQKGKKIYKFCICVIRKWKI